MRDKSESLECFEKSHMYAETHTGNKLQRLLLNQYNSCSGSEKIKVLRTDNGSEYLSNDFKKYLSDHCIQHQQTVAYMLEVTGVRLVRE